MAEKYNGIEKFIFSDIYILFLKYKDMENTDINWNNCINETESLNKKYKYHPLCVSMTLSITDQLSHIVGHSKLLGFSREQWEKAIQTNLKQ